MANCVECARLRELLAAAESRILEALENLEIARRQTQQADTERRDYQRWLEAAEAKLKELQECQTR